MESSLCYKKTVSASAFCWRWRRVPVLVRTAAGANVTDRRHGRSLTRWWCPQTVSFQYFLGLMRNKQKVDETPVSTDAAWWFSADDLRRVTCCFIKQFCGLGFIRGKRTRPASNAMRTGISANIMFAFLKKGLRLDKVLYSAYACVYRENNFHLQLSRRKQINKIALNWMLKTLLPSLSLIVKYRIWMGIMSQYEQ